MIPIRSILSAGSSQFSNLVNKVDGCRAVPIESRKIRPNTIQLYETEEDWVTGNFIVDNMIEGYRC